MKKKNKTLVFIAATYKDLKMTFTKKQRRLPILILVFFLFFSWTTLNAQCIITGLSPSSLDFTSSGGTKTTTIITSSYSCSLTFSTPAMDNWLTVTQPSPTTIQVVTQSNTGSSRTSYVTYIYNGNAQGFLVTQSAGVILPPTTPANPSIGTMTCDEVSLQRNGSPSSGTVWYWQGKNANGTSTNKGSGINFSANEGNGNYYIRARKNGIWSNNSGSISVTIPSPPALGVLNGTNTCSSSDIILTAITENKEPGLEHRWYNSATGSSYIVGVDIGALSLITQVTVSAQNKDYWVSAVRNGCESTRQKVSASYQNNTVPTINLNSTSNEKCSSSVFNIYASGGASGSVYRWYDQANNGTLLHTGSFYAPSINYEDTSVGIKTFYVEGILKNNLGCSFTITNRKSISVTVNPLPTIASANDVSRCESGVVTLTATPGINGNEIRWYNSPTGGVTLKTATIYTTASLTETTSFYAESYNSITGCVTSTRKKVQAIVNSISTWYLDADNDGHPISSILSCTKPGTGYTLSYNPIGDCNDSDPSIFEETTWYADTDNDGFGDPNATLISCSQPIGYVSNNTDLCPSNPSLSSECILSSPSSNPINHNYIYTRTYQTERNMSDPQLFKEDLGVIQQVSYFDGLGRPTQQIGIAQSSGIVKKDIVSHTDYDDFGRQKKKYLPYTIGNTTPGHYDINALNGIKDYYNTTKYDNTVNPFSEKDLESSPLNRILKQAAPGNDWALDSGHEIKFDYETNSHDQNNVSNPDNDNVRLFTVSITNNEPSLLPSTFYVTGKLYKTITKDENWTTGKNHTTEEFKNKKGQVILKRTYADIDLNQNNNIDLGENEIAHDTYYVYDYYGNLTYVLPPKVNLSDGVSALELENLCYQYKYDHRNRLIEKQIPGKGREYIVYDELDRPVMTKDALNQWFFTKYDVFGRVVYTGIYNGTDNLVTIKSNFENSTTTDQYYETKVTTGTGVDNSYYTNTNYPNINIEVLTINYYDDYNFGIPTEIQLPSTTYGRAIVNFNNNIPIKTKGLATGSKVKILDTNNWITTITGYEEKGRPIYIASKNEYLETVDISETAIDFVGKILQSRTQHIKAGTTIITIDNFTYDHVGRLLSQTQCIGNHTLGYSCPETGTVVADLPPLTGTISATTNAEATKSIVLMPNFRVVASPTVSFTAKIVSNVNQKLIASNTYDELGQLTSKKVGNNETTPLQIVNYNYNIRGWLKNINQDVHTDNDLFNFTLMYNNPTSGTALFNGNISQTSWNTMNIDSSVKTYTYAYDALNRITAASGANSFSNYDVSGISYDKMGNIMTLNRKGHTNAGATNFDNMDLLNYTYDTGNKLQTVTDTSGITTGFKDGNTSGNDYVYDANGNMTVDKNKGITAITYNYLNLPTQVTIANTEHNGNIQYVYDATGVKQRKIVSDGTTQDYAGNYIYKNNVLEFFNHPEGYVNNNNGAFEYIYQYKDHLGNVRLSYQDADNNGVIDAATEIIDEKNYYPFGLTHKGYNNNYSSLGNGVAKKFGFNGIELEEGLGLDMYEMGLRQYDPTIARWTAIDPVIHYDYSTYSSFDNNPVYWADPSGANSWTYVSGGVYRNNETGEETDDYQRAINETQNHFNESPQDKIVLNSESGYYSVTKTDDDFDEVIIDGVVTNAKKGVTEKAFNAKGYKKVEGVGMGAVDGAILYLAGEAVIQKLLKGSTWLYKAYKAKRASKGVNVAAGAVKFSDEAAKSIFELGTYPYFVSIKNGVARVGINFTKKIRPEALELVEGTLKANGANEIKVITNTVTPRFKKIFNYLSKKGGQYKGYNVRKRWNPLYPYELTKKL